MANDNQSIKTLLAELIAGINTLVRQEFRLAQAETSENVTQALTGIFSLFAGLLVAFAALLVLLQAVVVGLSNVIAPSYAALIVGVIVALIAFILIQQGQSRLRLGNFTPQRTLKSMREDKDLVMEKVQ